MGLVDDSPVLGRPGPMSVQPPARTSYGHVSEHLGPPSQIKLQVTAAQTIPGVPEPPH